MLESIFEVDVARRGLQLLSDRRQREIVRRDETDGAQREQAAQNAGRSLKAIAGVGARKELVAKEQD